MKKLAIIGASYLQEPLIQKAKEMGIETHVFAWAVGDIGEKSADYFYPISIVEKERIYEECVKIGIDGICSIASDLASITVNYVAERLNLVGNSAECVEISTNKYFMRKTFFKENIPCPKSILLDDLDRLDNLNLNYPVIVKPTDRSGSRGIVKVEHPQQLLEAIEIARTQSFENKVLIEEFAVGQEYSVEYISWKGKHHFLAMTKKYTTGAPNFIETAHMQPASINQDLLEKVKKVVSNALTALKIENGASHSELKISDDGRISIIEIGGRMGGDCIGSHLVHMSTGIDFVKAVIQVALGEEPELKRKENNPMAAVRFIFSEDDLKVLQKCRENNPEYIVEEDIREITEEKVTDSSTRFGYFLLSADKKEDILEYLPKENIGSAYEY